MSLNNIMIGVHMIGMISMAVTGFFTLTRTKNEKREYFVLFLFCAVFFSLGFIIEATSTTAEGGLIGKKVGYIGSILSAPMFLAFVQKYCEKELPKVIRFLLYTSAFAIIAVVWTIGFHDLFYTSYWFDDVSTVHHLVNTQGVLYPLGKIYPVICMLSAVFILLGGIKNAVRLQRKRLYILMTCAVTLSGANLASLFNVDIWGWGVFQLLLLLTGIFTIYFGILKYDLIENKRAQWVEKHIKDISPDKDTIHFGVECELCGAVYKTMQRKLNLIIETREMVFPEEYEQAVEDLSSILMKCPDCGRFVCEQCVVIDERGELCSGCAKLN